MLIDTGHLPSIVASSLAGYFTCPAQQPYGTYPCHPISQRMHKGIDKLMSCLLVLNLFKVN